MDVGGRFEVDREAWLPPWPKLTLDCEVLGGLPYSGRKPFAKLVVAIVNEGVERLRFA